MLEAGRGAGTIHGGQQLVLLHGEGGGTTGGEHCSNDVAAVYVLDNGFGHGMMLFDEVGRKVVMDCIRVETLKLGLRRCEERWTKGW